MLSPPQLLNQSPLTNPSVEQGLHFMFQRKFKARDGVDSWKGIDSVSVWKTFVMGEQKRTCADCSDIESPLLGAVHHDKLLLRNLVNRSWWRQLKRSCWEDNCRSEILIRRQLERCCWQFTSSFYWFSMFMDNKREIELVLCWLLLIR